MMYILGLLVEDRPGVLNRVASMFRRRGFNIETLAVGSTEKPGLSRMTITVKTSQEGIRRLMANLRKIIPVRQVEDLTGEPAVTREIALVRVAATLSTRPQVMQILDIFRARVVDIAPASLLAEVTGDPDKIDGLLEVLNPMGVLEFARTGMVALRRCGESQPAAVQTAREEAGFGPDLVASQGHLPVS